MLQKLCLIFLAIALIAAFTGCKKADDDLSVPTLEIPIETIPDLDESASPATRKTTVYYADAAGYLVPVTRTVKWEDGIAKATLSLMVKNDENDYDAAMLGLENVLPKGTKIDIDISKEKLATVSFSPEVDSCASALDEANMVNAVVCALTDFDSVDKVQILVNGYKTKTLRHGTEISQPISRGDINLETLSASTSLTGAQKLTLYFQSVESGAMVPVTRMVFSPNDIETAILELLKGPKENSGLSATLPDSAALLSVSQKDGVITINFTEEFVNIANNTDGGKNAIKSLMLTCAQFEGVKQVKLQINGKDWEPDAATLSVPTFINSDEDYIYTMSYE